MDIARCAPIPLGNGMRSWTATWRVILCRLEQAQHLLINLTNTSRGFWQVLRLLRNHGLPLWQDHQLAQPLSLESLEVRVRIDDPDTFLPNNILDRYADLDFTEDNPTPLTEWKMAWFMKHVGSTAIHHRMSPSSDGYFRHVEVQQVQASHTRDNLPQQMLEQSFVVESSLS